MAWLRPGFSGWAWVGLGLQARARTSLAPAPTLDHPPLFYLPYYGRREHSDERRIDRYHQFRKLPHRALKFLELVSVEKEDDGNLTRSRARRSDCQGDP